MRHFSLDELTHGRSASAPPAVRAALTALVDAVLDPWRDRCGRLLVTSGWRTPEENAVAGGEPRSQHLTGEAVDVVPLDCTQARAWELLTGIEYDQAIVYPQRGHIHVSYVSPLRPGRMNRRAKYRFPPGGGGHGYERL